ncbi:hypothetical protein QA612_21345 [Evansella sp. AB-P1]|uniref:hypothetical protein n=1 Tax=Evansella sp. AB-P1 TaxID=3037653 RepID=UPI0024203F51|nr:hypothetical protein [Evansella sp. AB-P1]MDG5790006.1 hypothetical protein [Evansella sp. AB-P1]
MTKMDDGEWHKTMIDGNRDATFTENKTGKTKNKVVSQRKSAIFSLLLLVLLFVVLWLIFST